MVGVTIGIGEGWGEVADRAACRVSEMTGLDCVVIRDNPEPGLHPSWLKLRALEALDGRDMLFFDADVMMMREWDAAVMFRQLGKPFVAVPDERSQPVLAECQAYGIPFPDCYVNAGLFLCSPAHANILREAWDRRPSFGSWLEQTALNRSLIESGCDVCRLPRRFNKLLWPGVDDYSAAALNRRTEAVLHAASLGGDWRKVAAVQDAAGL